MMSKDIKKAIAIALASGGIVAGGFIANDQLNQPDCAYIVEWEGEQVCFSEQEKEIIEQTVGVSRGFGGIKFGQQ